MEGDTPRVGLATDARMLFADATGVATYARALHAALPKIDPAFTLVADASTWGKPSRVIEKWARWMRTSDVRTRALRMVQRNDQLCLYRADLFRLSQVHFNRHKSLMKVFAPGPPGIVHWSYPIPIHLQGWANIYTVHDAIPLTHPSLTPIDPFRYHRLMREITAHAARIVTVSDHAAGEIIAQLECAPDLVANCGIAVEAPRQQSSGVLPEGLSSGRYFLFIGTIEPRKNLVGLARAYKASAAKMPLVIAGPDGDQSPQVLEEIQKIAGVTRLGYQAREQLDILVRSARALLFPSLAEGFGLPVIEAMAAGTPVMTSACGALRETADDAACLVDPESTEDMARAIARLEGDDPLIGALRSAGLKRAQAFRPEKFIEKLTVLYADIANEFHWIPTGAPAMPRPSDGRGSTWA